MKKLLSFGSTLLVGILLYANINADVLTRPEITGTTKRIWIQEGTTASLAPDVISADLEGINLLFDTPGAYMHEDNNGGDGTLHNLTTAFIQWSGITSSSATTGLTIDENNGTITIGAGLGGRYVGVLHSSFKAPAGKTVTMAVFKNGSIIDDIRRSMAKGPERMPAFRSISSDDSSAVFDTQSSIESLYASDGDDLIGIEAGTGSTGCSFIKIQYNNVDRPSAVRISTSAYQSNNTNHWMNVKMRNYSAGTYTELNSLAKDFEDVGATVEPYERVTWNFAVPNSPTKYVENNISEIVIYHNDVACSSAHKFHLDETKIIDAFSSAVIAFPVEFNVEAGDVLSLRYKANEDNVSMNISDLGFNMFKIGL